MCWIEVQPIEWLKDPSGVWVAKQALFSGVQFDRDSDYDGNFEKTDMQRYLDKYFVKEMQAGRDADKHVDEVQGKHTARVGDKKPHSSLAEAVAEAAKEKREKGSGGRGA